MRSYLDPCSNTDDCDKAEIRNAEYVNLGGDGGDCVLVVTH